MTILEWLRLVLDDLFEPDLASLKTRPRPSVEPDEPPQPANRERVLAQQRDLRLIRQER